MKICFICVEIFAWGKYGGFGRSTRLIGRELVKRGIDVCAVVPRRKGQKEIEQLDGITVYGFPKYAPWQAMKYFKGCNADVYHSEEPSFGTYLALKAMPNKKHMVTFRDPRDFQDWLIEFSEPSLHYLQVISNYVYEQNLFVKWAVRNVHKRFCAANCLAEKSKKIYALPQPPVFLPTPVEIPPHIKKAENPTVCFLARWDRRKRPEYFFQLAKKFPHVSFLATGKSRDDIHDTYLRNKYADVRNINMVGFVNQFNSNKVSELLAKSWILINTASREGLPNSFIEAAAHGCAILSAVDPDDFATRFGCLVKDDDFEKGLAYLLENNRWRAFGTAAREYVTRTFEIQKAIDMHIEIYKNLLKCKQ